MIPTLALPSLSSASEATAQKFDVMRQRLGDTAAQRIDTAKQDLNKAVAKLKATASDVKEKASDAFCAQCRELNCEQPVSPYVMPKYKGGTRRRKSKKTVTRKRKGRRSKHTKRR
jgi:hypothetical protein